MASRLYPRAKARGLTLANKYNIDRAYIFIGLVPNNQNLYTMLQSAGFILIFKPTVKYFIKGKETVKGNVDAELVLYAAAIEFANYERAVIVTSDGDFTCLIDYLVKCKKLLKIITPNKRYSLLLKPFSKYMVDINSIKKSIKNPASGIGRNLSPIWNW